MPRSLAAALGQLAILTLVAAMCGLAFGDVCLQKTESGHQLLRNSEPYFIKGAGGSDHLEQLAAAGGNSIRTWDAKGVDDLLDRAHELGLTVTVGLWLGQERHGFDYGNADAVARQHERAIGFIERYKDHPAVLMWGIGNEMEGSGDNTALWSAINAIASEAKKVDPGHPTMTVIAEVGGKKVANLHALCPNIDIVGLNSYGGARSVGMRYRAAGGTKPFVLTEFGPLGQWEVGKTAWGAPKEQTSTAKAGFYRESYEQAVLGNADLCLGSYAFLWGRKQEVTSTWFSMFLPDGSRLGPVDTMAELWSGKPPANRCPQIGSLVVDGSDGLDPGQLVEATLDVSDPEGDELQVEWVLRPESGNYALGGDPQKGMPDVPDAVVQSSLTDAQVRMPESGGGYRLFAFVRDGNGGAAVANVPLHVDGPKAAFTPPKAQLPLTLYADGQATTPYTPSGWMGKVHALTLDDACKANPHSGATCMRLDYSATDAWAGIAWQNPENDWGDKPGGYDLTGAKRLVVWARGENGGEQVELKLGILGQDKTYRDSASATTGTVSLTTEWQEFSLPLAGKDLSCLKTGFAWVVAGQGKPITCYLDDIRYE